MTRLASYFLPTLRDDPADAEWRSHKLMVRAGLVLPARRRDLDLAPCGTSGHPPNRGDHPVELDEIGAQEMLMPVLQPAELWRRTGRYRSTSSSSFTTARKRELVLAMTHEECVTFHIARDLRSYRRFCRKSSTTSRRRSATSHGRVRGCSARASSR